MTTMQIDRAVIEQVLEALETLVPTKGPSIYNSARDALHAALAQQAEPRNQCGETCERARLCATCAQALAQQDEPQGCATEEDCTKQPWCRIRGECQRKQAEPVEPVAWLQPKTVDAHTRPDLGYETCSKDDYGAFPVYTSPFQRKPLTEEEIDRATAQARDALLDHIYEYSTTAEGVLERIRNLCRAVERAVWEKNHG